MTFKVRWLKMAEGKSSVVTVCHCHDNEDPFRDDHSGGYSKTWDCEFGLLSALSGSYNVPLITEGTATPD